MNLKGWPFEPLDGDVKPLNGGGPRAGNTQSLSNYRSSL